MDFVLGKVRFVKEYNGIRLVVFKKKEIVLEDVINLEVKEVLEVKNKKYIFISIKLNVGIIMIIGVNMGGKSVVLKIIVENVLFF